MTAQPRKPRDQLQGHRSGRGAANVPHPEVPPANVVALIPVPSAPDGLLVRTRDAWAEFWKSDLARLIDRRNEGRHIIYRYFQLADECERARNAYRRARVVKGSTGQSALSPAFRAWMSLTAALLSYEKEVGLTTKGRLIFGLQAGRIKGEADKLNEGFEETEEPDEDFVVPEGIRVVNADVG